MFLPVTPKNLVLISLVPFLFACSKSKFSAVKTEPVPVQQTNPRPQPPPVYQVPNENYNNNDNHQVCNGGCRPTPPPIPPPRPTCLGGCQQEPPPVVVAPPTPRPRPQRPQPRPPVVEDCDEVTYPTPDYNSGVQGINIWVVMDGSKSNFNERATQLRALVSAYQTKLARQIPVTVSVITGHSRLSPHGVTYQDRKTDFFFRSRAGEPAVIRFTPSMDANAKAAAEQALASKILGMETDNTAGISDGGELLVYNLNAALHPERQAWARSVGALKDNYMLQVIFMTDENDICTPGRVANARKVNGIEVEAQAYRDHCFGLDTGVNDFNRNTNYSANEYSRTLYNALARVAQHRPVNLSGYVYTDPRTVPNQSEKEFANGIVQLIQATGGRPYDLAQLHSGSMTIQQAANDMVQKANVQGDLYVRFQVQKAGQVIPASELDMSRTEVTVGGKPVPVVPEGDHLVAQDRCDYKPVRIRYCRKK